VGEVIPEVVGSLSIEIYVDCPHCEAFLNILDETDTNGRYHNDEGFLLSQACPNGHWSEEHEKFDSEGIVCSSCKKEFVVKGLDW